MPDIMLEMGESLSFDITNDNKESCVNLKNAVLISLFSWRRANKDDDVSDFNTRFGYFGDNLEENYKIGSRLWLLKRSKITDETVKKAKEYIIEALSWLKEEKIASKIEVEVSRQNQDQVNARIKIIRADNSLISLNFYNLWQKLELN